MLEYNSVWLDQALQLQFADSVLISAYGNASLPRPAILQSRPAADEESVCVMIFDSSNVTVKNIHAGGCAVGLMFRISRNVSDIEVANCYFTDIYYGLQSIHPDDSTWGKAVDVAGAGFVNGMYIHNNIGTRMDAFFNPSVHIAGLILDSNTVS